jgi:hypothetical protein
LWSIRRGTRRFSVVSGRKFDWRVMKCGLLAGASGERGLKSCSIRAGRRPRWVSPGPVRLCPTETSSDVPVAVAVLPKSSLEIPVYHVGFPGHKGIWPCTASLLEGWWWELELR